MGPHVSGEKQVSQTDCWRSGDSSFACRFHMVFCIVSSDEKFATRASHGESGVVNRLPGNNMANHHPQKESEGKGLFVDFLIFQKGLEDHRFT